MLTIGDAIQCHDEADMIRTAEDLIAEGYGVSLRYGDWVIRIESLPEGEKSEACQH